MFPARLPARSAAWLLPFLLVASAGPGCTPPGGPPTTPAALLLPESARVRLTQHDFDVVAGQILAILKTLLGSNANGVAVVDVAKVLGAPLPPLQGGLGLFTGQASVRDLVLTLDLAGVQIALVEGSQPARVRITLDHARVGVEQGVVAGKASFAGLTSDAACHLRNGVDAGLPTARVATVSAHLDLVLDVDAAGKLAVQAQVDDPVLHDLGFTLGQDCALAECTDQVLAESPCLECDLCATGKLASDALQGMQQLLQPVLGQLLEAAGNLLLQTVLADQLNGKPLDLELPFDPHATLGKAQPLLGALLGPGGPVWLRARPSPAAFAVVAGGLEARMDAAAYAPAHPCVPVAGADDTPLFGQLVQGAAPAIPQTMPAAAANGQTAAVPVDFALVLGRNWLEEAVWAVSRSGLLCLAVDAATLHEASGGQLVLSAGLADLVLPGLRQLAGQDAPLRLQTVPSARPELAPLTTLAQDPGGATRIEATLSDLAVRVEALVRGRWLTVAELTADVQVALAVQVVEGRLRLAVSQATASDVQVVGKQTFAHAGLQVLAPAVAQAVTAVLLQKPMEFDVDVDALLASALQLPLSARLVALQAGGVQQDWLVLGAALDAAPTEAP